MKGPLLIPVTATNKPEWTRRAALATNSLITGQKDADTRLTALETFQTTATGDITTLQSRATALEAFQTTATASLTSLASRVTALETFAHTPFTVAGVTLTPGSLPGSPVKGMTVYDTADDKVKTWNGTAWQAHY